MRKESSSHGYFTRSTPLPGSQSLGSGRPATCQNDAPVRPSWMAWSGPHRSAQVSAGVQAVSRSSGSSPKVPTPQQGPSRNTGSTPKVPTPQQGPSRNTGSTQKVSNSLPTTPQAGSRSHSGPTTPQRATHPGPLRISSTINPSQQQSCGITPQTFRSLAKMSPMKYTSDNNKFTLSRPTGVITKSTLVVARRGTPPQAQSRHGMRPGITQAAASPSTFPSRPFVASSPALVRRVNGAIIIHENDMKLLQKSVATAKNLAASMASLQKEHGGGTATSLPPAPPPNRRGLVTSNQYSNPGTTFKNANGEKFSGNEAGGRYRSLPNSSSVNQNKDNNRNATSAPTANNGVPQKSESGHKIPPRVNTLVKGRQSQSRPPQTQDTDHSFAAGRPTRAVAAQNIKISSTKFASSWADARVDHISRGADPSPRRDNEQKKFPKSSTESEPDKNTSKSILTENKDTNVSKKRVTLAGSLETTMEEEEEEETDINEHKQTGPKAKKSFTRSRTHFSIPPRRERTRLKREKSSIKKGKGGQDDKYDLEDAARVYYDSVVNALNVIDSKLDDANEEGSQERRKSSVYADPQRNVPPWHRKEYVLNKKEADIYKKINSVYGEQTGKMRKNRENQFYKKLEQLQLEDWKNQHEYYRKKKEEHRLAKAKQQQQLQKVRRKFQEEQVKRFSTQYVTGKVLEHEHESRHQYGLPEYIGQDPKLAVKLKSKDKKPKNTLDTRELHKKNSRRYSKLFDIKVGPRWDPNAKTPKMEGTDYIVLENEDMQETEENKEETKTQQKISKKKSVSVKALVSDAQKMLDDVNNDEDLETPRSTRPKKERSILEKSGSEDRDELDSLDLSDDDSDDDRDEEEKQDAFALAMKKYGISLDDSDED